MARQSLNQSGQMSCGAACIAVALDELGIGNFKSDRATENAIYPQIWRTANGESAPALIDKYLNQQAGIRAWIMENPVRTAALMIGSRGALFKPWLEYSGELWKNSAWRYPRGLLEKDFNYDARIMLVSIIANSGLMHYILPGATVGNIISRIPTVAPTISTTIFLLVTLIVTIQRRSVESVTFTPEFAFGLRQRQRLGNFNL